MSSSFEDAYKAALAIKAKKQNDKKPINIETKLESETSAIAYKKENGHSKIKSLNSENKKVPVTYGKVTPKSKKKPAESQSFHNSGNVEKTSNFKLESNQFKGGRRSNKQELLALQQDLKNQKINVSVYNNINSTQWIAASQDGKKSYSLHLPPDTSLNVNVNSSSKFTKLILSPPKLIEHTQLSNKGGDRDLTVGLDFGTSCVKCVIGDRTIKQAYAIPFIQGHGVDTYLLPSILYENNEVYSLIESNISHNNLKLDFIKNPNNEYCSIKMTAFIALVLRQAITWFLKEHTSYINNEINWALSVGVPAPQGSINILPERYKQIARAAWYQAWGGEKISKASVLSALRRAKLYDEKVAPASSLEYVEVYAIPEIAAQIHGFVEATSFDPKDRNIFLLVDVGAGTVDSSLFHVKKVRGKTKFSFFESKVENLGVINLHRHRLDWWKNALNNIGNTSKNFIEQIDSIELHTESTIIPPKDLEDYFEKSKITFNSDEANPDLIFKRKLNEQVISTYRGSFINTSDQIKRNNLYGIKAFLCGGGFKMPFYHFIKSAITAVHGASYLHAIPIELQKPSNLESPAVDVNDYSRLSVAYGLSFIRAEIEKALPFERETDLPKTELNNNFISKDNV
jgi:hypothetical protein